MVCVEVEKKLCFTTKEELRVVLDNRDETELIGQEQLGTETEVDLLSFQQTVSKALYALQF